MKPGDKVRCIDNTGAQGYLDLGGIYTVVRATWEFVAVDSLHENVYRASRFELVEESPHDEYSFFAAVAADECPCKIPRSVCRYH
jgi:hypothetical protein